MEFLGNICHFPIQELNTWYFSDCSWLELLGLLPQLKVLRLASIITEVTPQESQLRYLKRLPLIIHTISFKMTENEDIVQLCQIMETLNVRRMIIDHSFGDGHCRWSLSQLKMFADKFPISQLTSDCIDINEDNVAEFIRIVAGIKGCRLILQQLLISEDFVYHFSLKDIRVDGRTRC